jgi:hypothetical protein
MNELQLFSSNQDAFEIFWGAGMRKINKKKARTIFERIAKKTPDPTRFAEALAQDIQTRLRLNQFGFSGLHPATYLNGERWEDELPQIKQIVQVETVEDRSTRDISFEETLTDRSWAL